MGSRIEIGAFRRSGGVAVIGVLAMIWTLLAPIGASAAFAAPANGSARNGTYLALGDSVAFGYRPSAAVPAPNYLDAHSFVGYPEDLARELDLHVANASCPGETTGSMLSVTAQSNGCENSVGSPDGYRTLYPLHVQYRGTQVAYAIKYLTDHKHTRLVTIDIGANDAFVCQETTPDYCAAPAELEGLIGEIETNLASIFSQVRSVYHGPLVTLTYYSLSYSNKAEATSTELLDSVLAGVASAYGGIVADGFTAFEAVSAGFGGDPFAAGLLVKLPNGSCNIHPSAYGHRVLAAAIADALK